MTEKKKRKTTNYRTPRVTSATWTAFQAGSKKRPNYYDVMIRKLTISSSNRLFNGRKFIFHILIKTVENASLLLTLILLQNESLSEIILVYFS